MKKYIFYKLPLQVDVGEVIHWVEVVVGQELEHAIPVSTIEYRCSMGEYYWN